MNINNAKEVLKKNILDQARYYLANANEFFPFGAAIDKNNDIKPIGIHFGEEHPIAIDVLKKLEKALKDGIEKNKYQYAAIGTDVYIDTNTSTSIEKKTALEIRFYSEDFSLKYYFLYFKKDDKYFFEESFNISSAIKSFIN